MAINYSLTSQPIGLPYNMVTTADVRVHRFVGFNGTECAAGAKAMGISSLEAPADSACPCEMLGALIVYSGAAVSPGTKVESDAEGRAITLTTGELNGWAVTGATVAGQKMLVARGI